MVPKKKPLRLVKRVVLVTGTPGTGKTLLARELSLFLHYFYLDANKMAKKVSSGYDKARKAHIIDETKLAKLLVQEAQKAKKKGLGLVIDSHMAQFMPKKWADVCLVTTCKLRSLSKRLTNRGYGAQKVQENLQAEIFQVCLLEAEGEGHKVIVVDTSRSSPSSLVRKLVRTWSVSDSETNRKKALNSRNKHSF